MANYWCHTCVGPTQPLGDELECPNCHGCFVEQVEDADNPENFVPLSNVDELKTPPVAAAAIPPAPAPAAHGSSAIHVLPGGMRVHVFSSSNNTGPSAGGLAAGGPFPSYLNPFVFNAPVGPFPPPQFQGQPGQPGQPVMFPFGDVQHLLDSLMGPGFGGMGMRHGDYAGDNIQHIINQLFMNDPNRHGAPPASAKAVQELHEQQVDSTLLRSLKDQDKLTDCSVCKDELNEGEKVKTLPCSHIFHVDCIMPWLKLHNSCPTCRYLLPTDDPHYERLRTQAEARRRNNNSNRSSVSSASSASATSSTSAAAAPTHSTSSASSTAASSASSAVTSNSSRPHSSVSAPAQTMSAAFSSSPSPTLSSSSSSFSVSFSSSASASHPPSSYSHSFSSPGSAVHYLNPSASANPNASSVGPTVVYGAPPNFPPLARVPSASGSGVSGATSSAPSSVSALSSSSTNISSISASSSDSSPSAASSQQPASFTSRVMSMFRRSPQSPSTSSSSAASASSTSSSNDSSQGGAGSWCSQ